MPGYDLADRLLGFAASICRLIDELPRTRTGKQVAGQLLRSGTLPGPNYEEACASESRRDFVHKLHICLKELKETRSWLKPITRLKLAPETETRVLIDEAEQLARIIGKSIVTAKTNS